MKLLHFYRFPGFSQEEQKVLLERTRHLVSPGIEAIDTEFCYNVEVSQPLSRRDKDVLQWLLCETFEPDQFGSRSFLGKGKNLVEVGPRLNFNTAWCTNAVSVCHSCGLLKVRRIERSRRYRLSGCDLTPELKTLFLGIVHDRMTECLYPHPLETFETGIEPESVFEVPILEEGRVALERINREAGLALDDWDLDYYTDLFHRIVGRNPSNVECFDIAQSNSEHSRHWFFKGRLFVDGEEMPQDLMTLIQDPLHKVSRNSTIAFKDNSSAIRGYPIRTIVPMQPGKPSPYVPDDPSYDVLFTAETHNFPSGVAPFPGAETGTGGRIRDVHATGRGSLVVAGTAAYCVGNLNIPGYRLPWEDSSFRYPETLAPPLQIEIEASNGASDYGNKFGEPVIQGYTRSFGLRMPGGERREWIKPIMFSGGVGQIDSRHRYKFEPHIDMLVVKIGGPAYRIGLGGGAASSMVQGENIAELDFNAVQRGDAEMEQKVNRVIRACVEMGEQNPIVSIHDQGAGGNCNVLKEIVDPEGARIELRKIPVGDETLSALEIWVAEYQEQDALLLDPQDLEQFEELCRREKVPMAVVGAITGDRHIVVYDERTGTSPVNLELARVLGKMPRKTFFLERQPLETRPLELPAGLTVKKALERVLRLLSVGSKRFLTNKADRSVTGLVARQQCAGPLQLTVADVAVIAQSHFSTTGAAIAIGEQPIIGLLDPKAMARMSLGEALMNLVWAQVSGLEDVKCSGNWMWAAKLPGEGARIYDAVTALREAMITVGVAIDGGKDSLSMAALAPDGRGGEETVKAPGSLVISAYGTCPDITRTVTPDLKLPGRGRLLYIDMGGGQYRLGGSALAHVFGQVGAIPPDVDNPYLIKSVFTEIQELSREGLITAGHDRSDGGVITTLLEMAFAGNCGIDVRFRTVDDTQNVMNVLFSEELGLVLEVDCEREEEIVRTLHESGVPCFPIGWTLEEKKVRIRVDEEVVLEEKMEALRDLWEETSFRLETRQANPACVRQEKRGLSRRQGPRYRLSFQPQPTSETLLQEGFKTRVAIIREEGSNGDREMCSAFFAAGFEPWDVTMTDLLNGEISLDLFRGVVFVGGFSYADVLDSAKGWAGVIRFNQGLWKQFQDFYSRPDTFSLGVCNGCQLMALLGWVPWPEIPDAQKPRFIHNSSGRFESRFSSLKIQKSPAIMLRGMAGSVLGVWVAHGEGRAFFPDETILAEVEKKGLAPVRYVDDNNRVTEAYPFNPNGSPRGIAGLCSPDGRHLVMMPHPERTFLKWQWGWMPESWKQELAVSPWLRMFQNAHEWCVETSRPSAGS